VLIMLFKQVDFHPLSISLLAQQLKERGPADVSERLEELLALQPLNREDRSLLASLELSIERLPEHCLPLLNRLGVFAGGCLEEMVCRVTGLEEADWQELRSHLLRAGLMQDERLPVVDMTFLRFHPTLAPALWQKLGKKEQDKLLESYWQAYYQLIDKLYWQDRKQPHAARTTAKDELPNLLRAVHAALQTDKAEEGVEFADKVNWFLRNFGMRRDCQALTEMTAKAGGAVGSQNWFVTRSNLGDQLQERGKAIEAAHIFEEILAGLGDTPSYNRCVTLHRLGFCFFIQGQSKEAERLYLQELNELAHLKKNQGVRRQTGAAQSNLADVLCLQGRYREAKEACQTALKIIKEIGDQRSVAAIIGQLGTLAHSQGELAEAVERPKEAIALFHSLNEPIHEAINLYNLGFVYQKAGNKEAAEQAYREAARIEEERTGEADLIGAAHSWNQLAQICKATGRLQEAEQWYGKALKARRAANDRLGMSITLSNIANLLADDSARLNEARRFAEESLAIKETLDPAAAEIWKTYNILARIASQQGESSQAAAYRAKSRQAYLAFPAWREQLYQHEALIAAVIKGSGVEAALDPYGEAWANLKAAIRRLRRGQRDEAALCEPLGYQEAAVIRAILEGIGGKG
jgi:tetratricopeptide (TPR) repeat protein